MVGGDNIQQQFFRFFSGLLQPQSDGGLAFVGNLFEDVLTALKLIGSGSQKPLNLFKQRAAICQSISSKTPEPLSDHRRAGSGDLLSLCALQPLCIAFS